MNFTTERVAKLNEARLAKVNKTLAAKVRELIAIANAQGYTLLITCGYRSNAEQNRLFAQGRSRPGKIVTNARAGQSKHNVGTAVDFAFIVKGLVSWDQSLYRKIGQWARMTGLEWGGNWKSIKDFPHVEL